jgi:hypothetical protein
MIEKPFWNKEKSLGVREGELAQKESAGISESVSLLQRLKQLFVKEAELMANPKLDLKSKCTQCLGAVEEQNAILKKLKGNSDLLFRMADESAKIFKKEEIDSYIASRSSLNNALQTMGASKMLEAKKAESIIEKLNFLVTYDLEMLIQDQNLRKILYSKAIKADIDQEDFMQSQYAKLVKDCRYLNDVLKYALGEDNLEKYALRIEADVNKKFIC